MPKHPPITLAQLRDTPAGRLPANAHLFDSTQKPKKRRAKFNNTKVEWEGLSFDSAKEYRRYRELLLMLKHAIIGQLRRQVPYLLIPATDTEHKTEYIADHVYIIAATGETVVEDVKSEATRKLPTYIIKRKLMLEKHGITIKEI